MKGFSKIANAASRFTGRSFCFGIALALILAWLLTGPVFGFSNTWQLVVNTGTTIITFLMVFLIQNTQNREALAVQLKLDELIRATHNAHDALLDLEAMDDAGLERFRKRYEALAEHALRRSRGSAASAGAPDSSGEDDPR